MNANRDTVHVSATVPFNCPVLVLLCSLAVFAFAKREVFVHSDSLKLHGQQVKGVFPSEAPPGER